MSETPPDGPPPASSRLDRDHGGQAQSECNIVKSSVNQDSSIRYYGQREGQGVWSGLVACFGLIGTGASWAGHSIMLTSCIVIGSVIVWYVGDWFLSRSHYFLSSDKAGFKNVFRTHEVRFEEVRSVTKRIGTSSASLIFTCEARTVSMPLDLFDDAWFSDLQAELQKRGISVTARMYGVELKEK